MAVPGDRLTVTCKLDRPLPISAGTHFAFREGNVTVAGGVITKLIPDSAEDIAEDTRREQAKKKKKTAKTAKEGPNA